MPQVKPKASGFSSLPSPALLFHTPCARRVADDRLTACLVSSWFLPGRSASSPLGPSHLVATISLLSWAAPGDRLLIVENSVSLSRNRHFFNCPPGKRQKCFTATFLFRVVSLFLMICMYLAAVEAVVLHLDHQRRNQRFETTQLSQRHDGLFLYHWRQLLSPSTAILPLTKRENEKRRVAEP